jgi:small-conductance mechanosensitive channel
MNTITLPGPAAAVSADRVSSFTEALPSLADATASLWSSLLVVATLLAAIVIALAAHALAYRLILAAARRTQHVSESTLKRVRLPSQLALAALTGLFLLPKLDAAPGVREGLRHAFSLLLILAVTILAVRLTWIGVYAYLARFDVKTSDNLGARRIHTQLTVVCRIFSAVIWVVGIAAALMTFPSVRQLGASMLASAGIAGLVVGLAAQRTLGNFIAGLQIALTEPINLDDVVIIEGEWGRIEEITATYVVVRIWDERRLIVPFSWFIERPFENWTRRNATILGTIFLWTDYTVPFDQLRAEASRLAKASPHWDGRVVSVVVTDTSERAIKLRVLASAADASKAWDLRCELREKLISFLQREHPDSLPRLRAAITAPPESAFAHAG